MRTTHISTGVGPRRARRRVQGSYGDTGSTLFHIVSSADGTHEGRWYRLDIQRLKSVIKGRFVKIFLILAVSSVLFIHGLGATSLWDPDEPRQAIMAREMMERSEYIRPYLNGKPYLEKPPLYPWMVIAASWISGTVDEFSARIPAALSATGLMVITYYLGCILADPSAGLLSALMLATNFQFLNSARDSVMDMAFALFIGAVILLSYLAIIHKKPWYLVLSFLPGALAMLTKGPAGLAVPAAIMFAYLCITKELRRFIIPLVVGCVLSGALGSMWFLVAGDDYWREFILRQNFVRYTSAFDHKESLFYYFPKIFNNFLPWSIPLPFAVYGAFKKKLWLPLVWLVITFLFFEFSASKRAVYLLPLYPACALLCGCYIRDRWQAFFDHRPTHCLLRLCALLLVVTPCAFLTSLLISSQPIFVAFRQDSTTYGAAAALTSVGIVLLFLLTKKRAASSLVALFVYFVVAGAFYHLLYLQVLDRTTKSPRLITESIRDSMPGGETATFGFDSPGVIFYLGKPVQTFYSSQAIKPAKSDIMLIVKDSFATDAKRELEEHFVPIRTVMYEGKNYTFYRNKYGQ